MPRTSKRSKPYTSLRKQIRHYRQKRAQFVKGLCASAHMNGSEFLIMLASPKGQVETFASEAFRPNVPHWFPENMLREAKQLASAAQEQRSKEREGVEESDRSDGEEDDDESDKEIEGHPHEPSSGAAEIEDSGNFPSSSSSAVHSPNLPFSTDLEPPRGEYRSALQTTNNFTLTPTSATSTVFSSDIPSFPSCDGSFGMSANDGAIPQYAHSAVARSFSMSHGLVNYIPVPDKFYEAKFTALQQKATKRIAKAWIKVIEPKKQTRFPYNKGEASKPSWWPRGLRHKEPDHLKSQERTELLISILRSPLIRVEKLELKTAEEASFLQQGKIPLLREIYRVAREEEKARDMGFIVRNATMSPLAPATLKRPHPGDSDAEDAPLSPPIPDDWRHISASYLPRHYCDAEGDHFRGVHMTGRPSSSENQAFEVGVGHQPTGSPQQNSPSGHRESATPGGPFTYQPLPGYRQISTSNNRRDLFQMHQMAHTTHSTPYVVPFTGTFLTGGASVYSNIHATPSLIHPRPQKYPRIDTGVLYTPGHQTPTSGNFSGSALAAPTIGDTLQSAYFPILSPKGDGSPQDFSSISSLLSVDRNASETLCAPLHFETSFDVAWQDNCNNGAASSTNAATPFNTHPSEAGTSSPAHSPDGSDVRCRTPENTEIGSPAPPYHQIDCSSMNPRALQ